MKEETFQSHILQPVKHRNKLEPQEAQAVDSGNYLLECHFSHFSTCQQLLGQSWLSERLMPLICNSTL